MRSNIFILIGLAVIILVGGFFLFQDRQEVMQPGIGGGPPSLSEQRRVEVQLDAVNASKINQSGEAILEEKNGKVVVTVDVNKVEGLNNQPVHIHLGSCPGVGEIRFPLNSVVDGRSVTEIDTTMEQLNAGQDSMAINLHKSVGELSVYTACGELPQ